MKEILCQYCNSKKVVKAGKRNLKYQSVQKFFCKSCRKYFADKNLRKSYPEKLVLNALMSYNLGYTLEQTRNSILQKFKLSVPKTTLHSWIREFSDVCTFTRIREKAISLSESEMILSQNFVHHQVYRFQLHQAKLNILLSYENKKFFLLKDYLEKVFRRELPEHIFVIPDEELEQRASKLKARLLNFKKIQKENLANKLAKLGLILANTNRERHQCVQNFMLINDSTTIATEVPVYLTNDDIGYFKTRGFTFDFESYRTPITGHIDILQIRNGLIHILDFKPEAEKVNAVNQLTIYALALASRTKLAVKDFKCAWFDDRNYYEFFPLHAVYNKTSQLFPSPSNQTKTHLVP